MFAIQSQSVKPEDQFCQQMAGMIIALGAMNFKEEKSKEIAKEIAKILVKMPALLNLFNPKVFENGVERLSQLSSLIESSFKEQKANLKESENGNLLLKDTVENLNDEVLN